MGLYKLFSYNVEVQYKSCLLSKAMLFTIVTTFLNITLPLIVAYRSRGFWLKSYNFYEKPTVHFKYEYLLVAETGDPSAPVICGVGPYMQHLSDDENCSHFQVQETDVDSDGKMDILNFIVELYVPDEGTIASIILILLLDFQLKTTCPLHMQTLAIIDKEFSFPSSGLTYSADLIFNQRKQIPCLKNHIDIKYNSSLLDQTENHQGNLVENILLAYARREVNTRLNNVYSRSRLGQTSTFELLAQIHIPEVEVRYKPSLLQELKWAWPQYLSLVIVFYWIFNRIKQFVFNNRLVMAWEVIPWKKN